MKKMKLSTEDDTDNNEILLLLDNALLYWFQVAEWATRAFFKYGGDSHLPSPGNPSGVHPPVTSPGSPISGGNLTGSYITRPGVDSPGFVTSTPHQAGMGQAVVRPELTRSSKHDGLCLYFARILEYVYDTVWQIDFMASQMYLVLRFSNILKLFLFFESSFIFIELSGMEDLCLRISSCLFLHNHNRFETPFTAYHFVNLCFFKHVLFHT